MLTSKTAMKHWNCICWQWWASCVQAVSVWSVLCVPRVLTFLGSWDTVYLVLQVGDCFLFTFFISVSIIIIRCFEQSDWFTPSGQWALFNSYRVNDASSKQKQNGRRELVFPQIFLNQKFWEWCCARKYKQGHEIWSESFPRIEKT